MEALKAEVELLRAQVPPPTRPPALLTQWHSQVAELQAAAGAAPVRAKIDQMSAEVHMNFFLRVMWWG
jgi:hypothetical protein